MGGRKQNGHSKLQLEVTSHITLKPFLGMDTKQQLFTVSW
jgi:hypothetical protein